MQKRIEAGDNLSRECPFCDEEEWIERNLIPATRMIEARCLTCNSKWTYQDAWEEMVTLFLLAGAVEEEESNVGTQ